MTFEAPRELLDPGTRDQTLEEIRAFGVDRIRVARLLEGLRARRDLRDAPDFDAADPAAYPAGAWDRLDGLFDVGAGARRHRAAHAHRPGPALGHARPSATTSRARARRSSRTSSPPSAAATATASRVWSIWNEPNHPQFLRPQYRKGRRSLPRHLPRALPRRPARACAPRATAPTRCCSARPRRAAPPRVVAPLAFLRGALCLDRSYAQGRTCERVDAGGFAHHAYTTRAGPRFRPAEPRRRDDRRALAADQGARPRGARRRDPRRLGVYLTEFGIQSTPDPFVGVTLAQPGRVPRDRRAHGLRQPARALVLAVPAAATTSRARARASSATAASSPACAAPTGEAKPSLRRASACRWRPRPTARSDVLWGRVRPAAGADAGHDPRLAPAGQEVQAAAHGHARTARGVFGLRATHRDKQRYRVRWTAPGGRSCSARRSAPPSLATAQCGGYAPRRWRSSSGSCGTARRCRTSARTTTPTAS